jgi:hypothetical protein
MRRCYFYLNDVDHKAILRNLEGKSAGFSEFVRQALVEKLDREAVIGHAAQAREDLDALVRELRQEIGRTRRDLMDDHARGLELVRQEVAKSMKKNEELQKAFVMALAGQAQPTKPSRAAPSEDGPMRIPG